jgi:hypothetical protein
LAVKTKASLLHHSSELWFIEAVILGRLLVKPIASVLVTVPPELNVIVTTRLPPLAPLGVSVIELVEEEPVQFVGLAHEYPVAHATEVTLNVSGSVTPHVAMVNPLGFDIVTSGVLIKLICKAFD